MIEMALQTTGKKTGHSINGPEPNNYPCGGKKETRYLLYHHTEKSTPDGLKIYKSNSEFLKKNIFTIPKWRKIS